eukprot:gene20673-24568_t
MTDAILQQRERGLLILQLNRPDKKNALTRAMYSQLAEALEQADADTSVNAVPVFNFMRSLLNCRKPVIAAVAGVAVGIGTTLLLHCDLVYVSRDARLRMPFVNLGLCPEFGSSLILPRLLGHAKAAELLLLGEGKHLMKSVDREQLRKVIEEEGALFTQRLKSPEAIAALSGFITRR